MGARRSLAPPAQCLPLALLLRHANPHPCHAQIVLDNKQRQSDTTLFKAASKWIFAESSRMEMADEVFRLLDISQELVQVLAQQQTALQFVQVGPWCALGALHDLVL